MQTRFVIHVNMLMCCYCNLVFEFLQNEREKDFVNIFVSRFVSIDSYLYVLQLLFVLSFQVNLYAGALFIQQSLGWNIYLSMIGLILITALLTITGGLTAVIYTDTLQALLMVSGATALTVLGTGTKNRFE